MLVEQCADFIRQWGLQEEGLFRLPGQANLVKELQDAFDCGEKPSFDWYGHVNILAFLFYLNAFNVYLVWLSSAPLETLWCITQPTQTDAVTECKYLANACNKLNMQLSLSYIQGDRNQATSATFCSEARMTINKTWKNIYQYLSPLPRNKGDKLKLGGTTHASCTAAPLCSLTSLLTELMTCHLAGSLIRHGNLLLTLLAH